MSRIKATVQFFHAWRHPDQIALEVEEELQFHIAKRTLANIENGMTPNEAQLAARQSFGHFHQIKTECCEIRRDLPFDHRPLRMGIYIAIALVVSTAAYAAPEVQKPNPEVLKREQLLKALDAPPPSYFNVCRGC